MKELSGTWKGASGVFDGKELSKEDVARLAITFKGNTYSFKSLDGHATEGTYKLDPTKKLGTFDAVHTAGPDKGKAVRGIYELTDGTFKLCVAAPGKDRPKEFASKQGNGHRLIVLERARD